MEEDDELDDERNLHPHDEMVTKVMVVGERGIINQYIFFISRLEKTCDSIVI